MKQNNNKKLKNIISKEKPESMRKPKMSKYKIVTLAAIILVLTGISILIYPYITNYFSGRQQAGILEEWEKEAVTATIGDSERISDVETSNENIMDKTDDTINGGGSSTSAESIVNDTSEELDYTTLTAEDFFPLRISIPKIELDWVVNEGTDVNTLKKGPGHIIETELPGDDGRCVISGHRTTYGAPFNKIDLLEPGDLIYL